MLLTRVHSPLLIKLHKFPTHVQSKLLFHLFVKHWNEIKSEQNTQGGILYPNKLERAQFCLKWNVTDSILENALSTLRKANRENNELKNETSSFEISPLNELNEESTSTTNIDKHFESEKLDKTKERILFKGQSTIDRWKKEYIWERMNDISRNPREKLLELQEVLNLSIKDIKLIIKEKKNSRTRGVITKEIKDKLFQKFLLIQQQEEKLLEDVVDDLKMDLGVDIAKEIQYILKSERSAYREWADEFALSVSQIRGIVKSFRDIKRGEFTEEKRKILTEYLNQNTTFSHSKIKKLCLELELSYIQIYSFLWKKIHSSNDRQIEGNYSLYFKKWTQENREQLLDHEAKNSFIESKMQEIIQNTNLGRVEILQYINYYLESRGVITNQVKNIVYNQLKQNGMRPLSRNEIKELSTQCKINSNQLRYIVRSILNPHTKATSEKKELLKKCLIDLKYPPTKIDIKSLQKQLHLSSQQILSVLYSLSKNKIKNSDIEFIKKWILINKKIPSKEEKKHIRQLLHLSPNQIKYIISKITDQSGDITFIKKNLIYQWLKDHNTLILPQDVREQFKEDLKLSSVQISSIIHAYKNHPGEFNDQVKSKLNEWYNLNKRLPNYEEVTTLIEITKLNRIQIREFMRRIHEKGEFSIEKKKIILDYIDSIDEKELLTQNLLKKIKQQTHLSMKQIREFINHELHPSGDLTKEKKEKIIQWLNERNEMKTLDENQNENQIISTQELLPLSKELELNIKQIRQQIDQIKRKQYIFTSEKKEKLFEWIGKFSDKPPSKQDIKIIANEIDLSPRQVYDFSRRHYSKIDKFISQKCG